MKLSFALKRLPLGRFHLLALHKWNKYPPVPPMIRVWEAVMEAHSAVTEVNFHTDSWKTPLFFLWVWHSEVLQISYFSDSLLCIRSLKFKESGRRESPGSLDAWNYRLIVAEKYILFLLNTGLCTFPFTGAAKFVPPKKQWRDMEGIWCWMQTFPLTIN